MVDCIGFHKKSTKVAYYTVSCAVVQVYNTGLLFVLTSADLGDTFLKPFKLGKGIYYDINSRWYTDVGANLVYSYIFVVVWPLIEWFYTMLLATLFVLIDGNCSCAEEVASRSHSVTEYVSIHSGPEFDIWNKYAAVISMVTVAFMWGISMPIYFPLCALGLMILYVTDRLRMAYVYK